MTYFLDTSTVLASIRANDEHVLARLQRIWDAEEFVSISSIVLFELWFGVAKGRQGDYRIANVNRLHAFLAGLVNVVAFEEEDAEIAGELRGMLARAGTPIGPYDVLIAAQALRTGMTLVTANLGKFGRMPGLAVEDWTRPL